MEGTIHTDTLAVVNRRGTVGDARLCARETEGKVSRIGRDR